ncbi:hypothetical protein JW707_00995 [Candidatus Woesearchaeota archaeon]|nr:hypothetical protein [Candidatus Woesearchaeota archaeon]
MAKKTAKKSEKKSGASQDEQIGFHKGALTTLAKEREEMMKILTIVEQLMQMHLKALKELGVDLAAEAKKVKSEAKPGSKPLESQLR